MSIKSNRLCDVIIRSVTQCLLCFFCRDIYTRSGAHIHMLPFSFSIANNSFKHSYLEVLERTNYTTHQKLIIKRRYLDIVVSAQSHYTWMRFMYLLFTISMTIGGVLVASFASFERANFNVTNSTVNDAFIWIIWSIGIIIALCGNLLHVLSIPKKYVLDRVILGKLQNEGWTFVSGVGRYSTITNIDERFKLFCTRVEKIRMKAIETMPELGASGEANDILSSGFDDSARDPIPSTDAVPQPNLKTFRRSKLTLPIKRAMGLSRSAEIPRRRTDAETGDIGNNSDDNIDADVEVVATPMQRSGMADNIATPMQRSGMADNPSITINLS